MAEKYFFHMFYELRFIYWTLHFLRGSLDSALKDEDILKLAYKVFYCGIGYDPDKELDYWLDENEKKFLMDEKKSIKEVDANFSIKKLFLHVQQTFLDESPPKKLDRFFWELPFVKSNTDQYSIEIPYYPFDGHAGRLGHYFRHLFQTVDFVAKQDEHFLSEKEKYEYLKILRAQLSNHEQLLLYYNAVAGFGQKWITKGFLTKYRFVRNLPVPLADFGIKPHDIFKKEIEEWKAKEKYFFEWDERKLKQIINRA